MRDLTYPPIIRAAKLGFKAMGLRFVIDGTDNVPTTGGVVLALNHISYVDFIFGGYAVLPAKRLVRFMAKRELFDHRLTGPLMRSLHHIEVDRAAGLGSYRTAVEYLRAGEVVGVFPEATISRSFELKDFKTGAVRMAAEADVPVLPAVMWGTQRIYTKDHPRDFSRGKTIAIRVGAPLTVAGGNPEAETKRLQTVMSELLDTAIRAYPERDDASWWTPRSYGGSAPTPEEAAILDAEERERRLRKRRGTPPDGPPAGSGA